MRHRTEGPARSPLESAPLAPGRGVLAFARVEGETALVRRAARSPLQILSPRRCGRAAWAILSSHGGGLVAGDTLSLDVDVGPGATALLTTQSEGKVYRSTGGETAAQALRARIEGGGVLVALPVTTGLTGSMFHRNHRYQGTSPDGEPFIE